MMRLLACLLFVASALPSVAHPPAQLSLDAEKGIALEIQDFRERLVKAVRGKDVKTLRDMYAESYLHTHTTAKTDGRDARIVSLLAGDPVIELAPSDDTVVRSHAGGWLAIAFGTSPIKSLADEKTYIVRWTMMFSRTDGGWQIVASQATRSHELKK